MTMVARAGQPDRSAWQPGWADAVCIVLLVTLSFFLFIRHAPVVSNSHDGFTMTYLVDQDFLGYFAWQPAKEPGRPFVGVPFRLVHDLFGGSVTALNLAQSVVYTVTGVAVFVMVRLLFPAMPVLAWAAAALKITWTFEQWLLLNYGLNIRFTEMLFAISFVALLLCAGPYGGRGRTRTLVRAGLVAVIVVALPIGAGGYQGAWPLIAFAPLLVAGPVRRHESFARGAVIAWYAAFAAGAAVSMASLVTFRYAGMSAAPGVALEAWLIGVRAVIIDAFWQPARLAWAHPGSVVTMIIFLLVGLGLVRLGDHDRSRPLRRGAWPWLAFGVVVVLVTLLGPSLKGTPTWGTRFGYFAAWGYMIIVLSLAAIACNTGRRPVQWIAGGLICFIVFTQTTFWLDHSANCTLAFAEDNVQQRRVVELVSNLEEDTIVTVEPALRFDEFMQTAIVRMVSDTHRTYWLSQPEVTEDADGRLMVRSNFPLPTTDESPPREPGSWFHTCRFPRGFTADATGDSLVDAERRLAFHWDVTLNRFLPASPPGDAGRLGQGDISPYAMRLFPDLERRRGGVYIQRERVRVLAHVGPDATPAFRYYDWHPDSCAIVAASVHAVTPDGTFVPGPWPIAVQVPPGATRQLVFRVRGSTSTLAFEDTINGTTWMIPCDATPTTWQSPPLAPGGYVFRLRVREGQTARLDSFSLVPTAR